MKSVLTMTGIAIVLATMHSAYGQTGTAPATRGRPDPVQRELQRRFESEAIERALVKGPGRHPGPEWRITLAQIKEDFLRIQIVNDDLRKFAKPTEPFDLKVVAKSASEITKRAERLRENLALPEIKNTAGLAGQKSETGIEQLRSSLLDLSNVINSFVENPVFEKSGVIDAKLSTQARCDLDRIIEVSRQIKRNSEKLKRVA